MIHIRPPHLRVKEKELPNTKTFSYDDVERMICNALHALNFSDLVKQSGLVILCKRNLAERGVDLIIRKGEDTQKIPLLLERRNENAR